MIARDHNNRWSGIAVEIASNPRLSIQCPYCSVALLQVRDAIVLGDGDYVIDRFVECPACKSRNIITMRRNDQLPDLNSVATRISIVDSFAKVFDSKAAVKAWLDSCDWKVAGVVEVTFVSSDGETVLF